MNKSIILKAFFLYFLLSCSASTENDNNKNDSSVNITVTGSSHYWATENKLFRVFDSNYPTLYTNVFDESKTYKLKFKGVYLGHQYTMNLEDYSTDTISNDSVSTSLHFNFDNVNFASDYYEAELLVVESSNNYDVMVNGKKAHFYDGDATDHAILIQVETENWRARDSIVVADGMRIRPYPNMVNTAGKLYFYDMNLNLKDSIGNNGANGQRGSDGVIRYFSLSYSSTNLAKLTINSGNYLVRFENSGRTQVSPFRKVKFVK